MKTINEGFLARLTKEYCKETIRNEDKIEGVEYNHSFTDMNGTFHKNGYKIINGGYYALKNLISKLVMERGFKADLNDIDVSNSTDMGELFEGFDWDGDLSGWDVSNVVDFDYMFHSCCFNNHSIDNWRLNTEEGKEIELDSMFSGTANKIIDRSNIDLSNWDTRNVSSFRGMFKMTKFNGDLSSWNISKGKDFGSMFLISNFDGDLSNWKIPKNANIYRMFERCTIKDEHKPKNNY